MQTYKLVIAYDGTSYAGWQSQPHHKAITNVLQDTFFKIFSKKIKLLGASRTDAGVHAVGQVARFATDLAIAPDQMMYAWNNLLPSDIMIRSIQKVDDSFHPIVLVTQKIYWYHIFLRPPLPFVARYGYYFYGSVDLKKFNDALQLFVGTHDFRSFASGNEKENTVRTIDYITLEYVRVLNGYRVTVAGKGFLKYMIRRIVGACLHSASNPDVSLQEVQRVFLAKNPEHYLSKAPACGLVLRKVKY